MNNEHLTETPLSMNLSNFLAKFATVLREADGWVVPCPAHADGSPSLRIALNERNDVLLHCRAGCKKAAVLKAMPVPISSLFNLVLDVDAVQIGSQATAAATPVMIAQMRMYTLEAATKLTGSDAEQYAAQRFGVSAELAARLTLGFDAGGLADVAHRGKAYARAPRLVVPFKGFDGVTRAVQGRALVPDETRWCGFSNGDDGERWARFGFFAASDTPSEYVIITEGPGDALTAAAAGHDAVFIRGTSLAGVAAEFTEALKGYTVVVAGDRDAAGAEFNTAVADVLGAVVFLAAPDGANDLSEWYEQDTAAGEEFSRVLAEALLHAEVAALETAAPAPAPAPVAAAPVTVPDPEAKFRHTQLGNAQRLAARYNGDIKYTPEAGFMLYNGVTWEQDRFNGVRTAAQTMLIDETERYFTLAAEMTQNGDEAGAEEAKKVASYMITSQSSHGIDAVLKELKALYGVACSIEMFDAHAHFLAFRNGVVDLRSGELVDGSNRELLITRQLKVSYNAAAKCPQWLTFLDEVFPNHPDMPAYLQRLIGYGITGNTDEQCFVVLHGSGANGKSVFTETLSEVFAAITNTTPFSTFEEKPGGGIPNDVAALKGARLVMASEGEAGKPMAESLLKRVTGHDLISARFMRQEFFTFRPSFLLMLGTNHKPQFRGQDEGLWRRVKLISWERYFKPEERDNTIWERLVGEAEGIAAWAVAGAAAWYKHKLQDPDSILLATMNYRANADALAGFFPGVLEPDVDGQVLGTEAFTAYVAWCEEEHLPHKERWTRRAFYSAMEERGVPRKRCEKGQTLVGVRHVTAYSGLDPLGAV